MSAPCPRCDGDGYLDIVNDFGGVDGPMPCPDCNASGDAAYVQCPGAGIDDLCAQAQGLNPFEDGCGLCTLGMNPALLAARSPSGKEQP